ncbi:hypothetical protein AAC387_Pa04g1554 [Persea americana]
MIWLLHKSLARVMPGLIMIGLEVGHSHLVSFVCFSISLHLGIRLKGGIVQFDITEVPPAVEVKENVIPDTTPKAAQDADLKSNGKPTRKFVFRTAAFIDPSPPCPG